MPKIAEDLKALNIPCVNASPGSALTLGRSSTSRTMLPLISQSPKLPDLIVRGMQGLGDNIFQRPFIHALSRQWTVYLETSWPELYADLPVKVVRSTTRLRTQAKNINRARVAWSSVPSNCMHTRKISYVHALKTKGSLVQGMEHTFGIGFDPQLFDLPPLPPSPLTTDKPIAFIRPVTIRPEWLNDSRGPKPEYIAAIVDELRPTHHIVVVADVEDRAEWFVGSRPRAIPNSSVVNCRRCKCLPCWGHPTLLSVASGSSFPPPLHLKSSASSSSAEWAAIMRRISLLIHASTVRVLASQYLGTSANAPT